MQVLEKNLPGVNQRFIKTESVAFWQLLGVWPEQNGIQNRLLGKNLIHKFDNPVESIFQFWTPYGYAGGIFQTKGGGIDTAIWDVVDVGFKLTPTKDIIIPGTVPVNSDGLSGGEGSQGSNGTTGLGGSGFKYILTYIDTPIAPYATDAKEYAGSPSTTTIDQDCGFSVPMQPECAAFSYPPLGDLGDVPLATFPIVPFGDLFSSVNGGFAQTSVTQLSHPPGVYNDQIVTFKQATQRYTVVTYDFSPLVASLNANFKFATLLAVSNTDFGSGNVNYQTEISFDPVTNPILTLDSRTNRQNSFTTFNPPIGFAGPFQTKQTIQGNYADSAIVTIRIYYLTRVPR